MSLLPNNIDKDSDWDLWEEFLKKVPQEDLVDFLLGRMAADSHFMTLIHGKFEKNDMQAEGAKNLMQAYNTEIDLEWNNEKPDLQYVVSLTNRFLEAAKELTESDIKLFKEFILKKLEEGLYEKNMQQAEDGCLLEDLMHDIIRSMK